jgi:hypothetical protein
VFYLIADEETGQKLQISQAAYDHMKTNARRLEEKLPGVKVMPTAARMSRKVYKRAFLGNELLQSGDAPIKGRFSWACITGELDRNKGHWFGLIKTKSATESMNRTATMKQNQRKYSAGIAQIHRERRDNKHASAWLAKHSLKAKPKPKPLPLERWQKRVRVQKQERRALAKPLLKGVE